MSIEVKVPQLPESVADATLVAWHKSPGDPVERDENLVDLETDKVVLEVPAPASGVLKEIRIPDGTTVTSGEVLAVLEEGGAAAGKRGEGDAAAGKRGDGDAAAGKRGDGDKATAQPETSRAGTGAGESRKDDEEGAAAAKGRGAARLSPSVRRLVEEHDIDPDEIDGSGKDGRITKADVVSFIERKERAPAKAPRQPARAPAEQRAPERSAARGEERVPMTRLRARIAERMVQAQSEAAMLTSFNEVDLAAVMALRTRYREKFEKAHGVRLGFMSFFIKASIEALKKFPVVNASVDGRDIVYHEFHDIGIAVSTDRGLLVPVLRDAGLKSFAEIERDIEAYAEHARDGTISLDDLTGGTFTITNGGVFGSLMSTPIINPPQSAILGMHKIQDRPMAVDGEIRIRPMMYIALTYDHRIIDGREAVLFLVAVKEALEDPARLLIGI
ncbi:MAG TPA: 2-oxoglutarate dehydrogenase complex dihydrolipoyllysine-residue succinyltransferase [Gammaproteobacteria bacterium]|nr:2-oxoglutarate dehydrogenase complex dihydrolipoyllysine-residue succinyltransferase [Gammaproteobacteria bacterium]